MIGVETTMQSLQRSGGLIFLLELNINVAEDHVICEVMADVEALDLSKLVEFFENVLVEILEVVLDFAGVDGVALGVDAWGDHVGAVVHVG